MLCLARLAHSVAESLGVGRDVRFQFVPRSVLGPDVLAVKADGQDTFEDVDSALLSLDSVGQDRRQDEHHHMDAGVHASDDWRERRFPKLHHESDEGKQDGEPYPRQETQEPTSPTEWG